MGASAGRIAEPVRNRHSERKVGAPDDGWSALVSGSLTTDGSAAACRHSEPPAPASGSRRYRLGGSGRPACQRCAEAFADESDVLVVAQAIVQFAL
jgi:hypothetical protein